MYKNHRPRDEYRTEDNPHTPTNLPDDLEERCHRIFEHTETWSVNSGAVTYVYPKTENGYDDYSLMLDYMGAETGAVLDYEDRRMVVLERLDASVKWGDWYSVERGGVRVYDVIEEKEFKIAPGETYSPKSLWKAYIYGDVEKVGMVQDM